VLIVANYDIKKLYSPPVLPIAARYFKHIKIKIGYQKDIYRIGVD